MSEDPRTGLLSSGSGSRTSLGRQSPSSSTDTEKPLYHAGSQSPTSRLLQLAFVCVVILMVLITIILSIYRGATYGGFLYFMMGISLIGLVVLEIFLVQFSRSGDLTEGKNWFLYFVGFCVVVESIFTNILLFDD